MAEPDDPIDERIRSLLTRAVWSAPPAPAAHEIETPAAPTAAAAIPVPSPTAAAAIPVPSPARRAGLALAACVAVVVAVMAVGRAGGPSGGPDRVAGPGDLAVWLVPDEAPPGLRLSELGSTDPTSAAPRPRVAVYEGGGVTVRITDGRPGWAVVASPSTTVPDIGGPGTTGPGTTGADTTGPGTTGPGSTGADATTGPGTTGADTTTGPGTTGADTTTGPGTTGPGSTGAGTTRPATVPPGTTPASESTTTTDMAPPTTAAPGIAPSLAGLPARTGIGALTVRGLTGGQEVHDGTTSTVWFVHDDRLVAVDVFGLGPADAVHLADGLTLRADGGFEPAAAAGLVEVATIPGDGDGDGDGGDGEPVETARLVYTDEATGEPGLAVTTEALPPDRRDLLVATAGSFGRLVRWGDREVLLDAGSVAFVDPAGALVVVLAPAGEDELRAYVEGLRPLDRSAWEELVADHPDLTTPPAPASTAPTTTVPAPTATTTTTTGPPPT